MKAKLFSGQSFKTGLKVFVVGLPGFVIGLFFAFFIGVFAALNLSPIWLIVASIIVSILVGGWAAQRFWGWH